jgi:signal peptidase II
VSNPPEVDAAQAAAGSPGTGGLSVLTVGLASLVVGGDQATKALVRARLPLHSSRAVIPGLLDLTHVQNTGAAFGILNAADFPHKAALIAVVAAVALVSIAIYAARVSPHQLFARIGLALILGGAAGNLIDRFVAGYVIDFVDVYWGRYHFWAFNVADSAITVGVVGMMLDMIGLGWPGPGAPASPHR